MRIVTRFLWSADRFAPLPRTRGPFLDDLVLVLLVAELRDRLEDDFMFGS
jgi:hypothetical protein